MSLGKPAFAPTSSKSCMLEACSLWACGLRTYSLGADSFSQPIWDLCVVSTTQSQAFAGLLNISFIFITKHHHDEAAPSRQACNHIKRASNAILLSLNVNKDITSARWKRDNTSGGKRNGNGMPRRSKTSLRSYFVSYTFKGME